jgi:hypothetical protein
MPADEIRNVKFDLQLLPDRQRFELSDESWKAFEAAMDAPMKPSPRLQQLLCTPSVFEMGKSGHSGEIG